MSSAELNRKKLDLIAWIVQLSDERMIELLESIKASHSTDDRLAKLSEYQKQVIRK